METDFLGNCCGTVLSLIQWKSRSEKESVFWKIFSHCGFRWPKNQCLKKGKCIRRILRETASVDSNIWYLFFSPSWVHGNSHRFLTLSYFDSIQKRKFLSLHTLQKLADRWYSSGGKNEEVMSALQKTCKSKSCTQLSPEKIRSDIKFCLFSQTGWERMECWECVCLRDELLVMAS